MSDSLGSWIAKLLVSHDSKYGADFGRVITVNRCFQLIDFPTSRDAQHPHRQIIGTASDQTHTVRVAFDVAATDRFEQPQAVGVPAERLTSHLRAVFLIRRCRIRLTDRPRPIISRGRDRDLSRSSSRASRSTSTSTPAFTFDQPDRPPPSPAPAPAPDVPIVWLDVLDWDVLSGDRNEPTYWENAEEVGMGKGRLDAEVQKVLRKWWTGESNSEPSQIAVTQESPSPSPNKFNAIAGPSRIPARSPNPPGETSPELQSFAQFLEPYLKPPPGKKAKPIPEWIFEVSPETRRELDAIQMFGLDIHATDMFEGGVAVGDPAETSVSVLATPSGSTSDKSNAPHLSPPSVSGPSSKAEVHLPISDPTPKDQPSEQEGDGISTTSVSFPRPRQDTPLTYPQTQGGFPLASQREQSEQNKPVEQSESEDDDMHIRAFAPIKRNRRAGFDPLGFSSPAQMSSPAGVPGLFDASLGHEDEEAARHQYEDMEMSREQEQSENDDEEEEERNEEETDEEELSSYEREQRRLGMDMARGVTAADSSPISQWGRAHRPSPRQDDVDNVKHQVGIPVASQQSESLSASQQSHDLSLSHFNKPPAQRADTGVGALDRAFSQGDPKGTVAEQELMGTGGNPVQMGADAIHDNTKRSVGSPRTTHKRGQPESFMAIPQPEGESNHSADVSSPAKRRRPDIPSQNNGASDESPVGIQVATQSTPSGRTTFGLGQGLSNVIQRIMSAGRATSVPVDRADRSGSPVKRFSAEGPGVGVDQRGLGGDRAGSVFAMLKPWWRGDDHSLTESEEGVDGLERVGEPWVPGDRTQMYEGVDEVKKEEEEGADEQGAQVGQVVELHEEETRLGAERGEEDELHDQPHHRGSQSESEEDAVAAGEKSTLSAVETKGDEGDEGEKGEPAWSDIDVREDKHVLESRHTATPTRAPKLEPQTQSKLGQLTHLAHPHLAESRLDRFVLQAHRRPSHDGPIKSSPHSPSRAIKSSPRSPKHLQRQYLSRDDPGSSVGIKVHEQSPLPPQLPLPPLREQRVQPQSVLQIQPQPLISVSARIGDAPPTQAEMQTHTLGKLGGWKPHLTVHSGLTGEWIKERTNLVRTKRGRARADSAGRTSLAA